MRARVANHHPETTFHTASTASLSVVSLRDVDFGPLLAAFGRVLRIFVTVSLPKCARRAVLGKSFCVSDAVGTSQPVEKLLHVPIRSPFADSTPRSCSVLVVVSRRLDLIWRTGWLDHDFFNRLKPSTHLEAARIGS